MNSKSKTTKKAPSDFSEGAFQALLCSWGTQTIPGRHFFALERRYIEEFTRTRYAQVAAQCGLCQLPLLKQSNRFKQLVRLEVADYLVQKPGYLPKLDLIVLPHAQLQTDRDYSHVLLRSCAQRLSPGGALIVSEFSSRVWQAWATSGSRLKAILPEHCFRTRAQVQAGLCQLGLCIRAARFFSYQLPCKYIPQTLQSGLELAGARWWPSASNAYLIMADLA